MRTTTITAALGLTLAATVITACGSKDEGPNDGSSAASSAYCRELKTDKAYFQSLAGIQDPDLGTIQETFRRVHSLAAAAPADVSDEWQSLDHTVTGIEDVLDESGLSPSDFAALQKGEIPEDVDVDKLAALAPKMQSFGSAMDEAAGRIAENAKATCGIDLQAG